MKYLLTPILLCCFLLIAPCLQAQVVLDRFFNEADAFFKQSVVNEKVDYASIYNRPDALNKLVVDIANANLSAETAAVQKAFLINAYNLLVIKAVIDAWPISSPLKANGFFDQKKYNVSGKSVSLDELEKKIILVQFPDPRLHFVLVCAALSCPPITASAYRPETLDKRLDEQSRKALNDPQFIRVDIENNKVSLSQIFEWYASDFEPQGGSLAFINRYRENSIPNDYAIGYYPYDWTLNGYSTSEEKPTDVSNVQLFTPSVLLGAGQVDAKIFNNIYTQTAFRNADREKVELGERQTFYTGTIQINYGISKSRRINLGFEANINSVRYDSDTSSSPFLILGGDDETEIFSRTVLGSIGPRIRLQPFVKLPKFSLTSTLQIPLHQDLESPRFLAHNRTIWWTQFFYDKSFGKFQLFSEVDFQLYFPTKNPSFTQDAFFRTPATIFFSYFPGTRTTLNVNIQYSPAFVGLPGNDRGKSLGYDRDFAQAGIGAKYQLTPEINLEVIYTNFFTSRNEGAGQTFNLGFVFIR